MIQDTQEYHFREWRIRAEMVAALHLYVTRRAPLGDFLRAVVSNDLKGACGHADDDNLYNLPAFAAYMYNEMPAAVQGSEKRYEEWIAQAQKERPQ